MKWRVLLGVTYVAVMALPYYLADADGSYSECLAVLESNRTLLDLWTWVPAIVTAVAILRWWGIIFPLVAFLLIAPLGDTVCGDGTQDYYYGWAYLRETFIPFAVVALASGIIWFVRDLRRLQRGERDRIPLPRG